MISTRNIIINIIISQPWGGSLSTR